VTIFLLKINKKFGKSLGFFIFSVNATNLLLYAKKNRQILNITKLKENNPCLQLFKLAQYF